MPRPARRNPASPVGRRPGGGRLTLSIHHRLRDALLRAGGTPGADTPRTHAAPPVHSPFAASTPIEHAAVRAVDVGGPAEPPEGTGFLDGIQRYAVAGRIGLTPVVRAVVAAAVLTRRAGALRPAQVAHEEFVVVPFARLTGAQRSALEEADLQLLECEVDERAHPILDVQAAVHVIEQRREALERQVAEAHLVEERDAWLVVDGPIGALTWRGDGPPRVLGIVKSHETQYLEGPDLEAALTLPAGHRTSVFGRATGGRGGRREAFSWYLRLWPWEDHDLLFGLVRLERPSVPEVAGEATAVSRWILAERAPLAAPDGRWDRLIYPIQQVETYLRAQAGGWL